MKKMLIDDTLPEETRVVILDDNKVEDVEFESSVKKQIKGNIFTAKVVRIEPSLQAAFVDYGGNRHGFLAFGEIHPDYYNITDEIKAEVEAEVDEIIARKRTYQAERKAEQERRRLEREQKRAEYEARKKTEEEQAAQQQTDEISDAEENKNSEASLNNDSLTQSKNEENTTSCTCDDDSSSEQNQEDCSKHTDCGCDENCSCRQKDGQCHCHENGVCTCDHKSETQQQDTSSDSSVTDSSEGMQKDENDEPTSEQTAQNSNSDEQNSNSDEQNENSDEQNEDSSTKTRRNSRRGARFLGVRHNKYKISAEAIGLANSSVAEEINEDEMPNEQLSKDDNNFDDDERTCREFDNDEDEADFEHYLEIQRKLIYARKLYYRSTIQDVIKEGQTVLIQIVKEERGNKGAACTTYLSLAGRYCVLMPNRIKSGGVSRKITSVTDRKRLKEIMHDLPLNDNMSLIIRTAGEDKQKEDIVRDYNYLIRSWNHIRHTALSTPAPALIYEEGDLIKRALRDMYTKDIEEVIIDGDEAYKNAKAFSKILSPNMSRKIKCRKPNDPPVFQQYQIERELDKLHNPVVQLQSGGYLVINPTEALVSIDVNSGRATHEMDIEETALKTNLEAADEIAKQLRMRNLAGLVVIDFIDMEEPANNHAVEKRMKEAMKPDRARVQIAKMSIFGLLEISRQRMHSSFIESNYVTCPYCKGQGVQRTLESGSALIIRAIEEEGIKGVNNHLELKLPADIAVYILNHKRRQLADLEEKYNLEIIVSTDLNIKNINDYKLEKSRVVIKKVEKSSIASTYSTNEDEITDDDTEDDNEATIDNSDDSTDETGQYNNRYNRRRGRYNNRRRNRYSRKSQNDEAETTPQKTEKKTWWKKLLGK